MGKLTMQPLWQPSAQRIEQSHLYHFMQSLGFQNYDALYQFSCENPAVFWQKLAEYTGVIFHQPAHTILENAHAMPGAKWFVGATLNFAENLLRRKDDHLALIAINEKGERKTTTYAQLHDEVSCLVQAFQQAGLQKGDRVAAIVPNCAEAIKAMLAVTSLGGVWASCSPDFGENAIIDRFAQITPKFLVTTNGYFFKGNTVDVREKATHVAAQIPSLQQVITIDFTPEAFSAAPLFVSWQTFMAPFAPLPTIPFIALAFADPLYILFSSGTTGKPKCIVHSTGGTLLQHLKELFLHTDLQEKDHFFFYTTCGWMMWNWLVSGLATGATLILYDGNPFYPNAARLLDLIEQEKISIFGTSAKFIASLQKSDYVASQKFSFLSLRTILSTGSPLLPENFEYVYQQLKADVCLSSISGGTDIISCFALGNPLLPVYAGELQSIGLGMAVKIYNEAGESITKEKGELVCTQPFPSMPVGFWNDPTGSRYHAAYFEKFPSVWSHGDYAALTVHKGLIVYGRSDAVLNPGGVRIGTAEIYAQVEKIAEVEESIAVGQLWENDERIILFVKLKPGKSLTPELEAEIRQKIRHNASPRHVPAKIIAIADIPRTINNKISEIAVKNKIHGWEIKNKEALANPEALLLYENIPQLQS